MLLGFRRVHFIGLPGADPSPGTLAQIERDFPVSRLGPPPTPHRRAFKQQNREIKASNPKWNKTLLYYGNLVMHGYDDSELQFGAPVWTSFEETNPICAAALTRRCLHIPRLSPAGTPFASPFRTGKENNNVALLLNSEFYQHLTKPICFHAIGSPARCAIGRSFEFFFFSPYNLNRKL